MEEQRGVYTNIAMVFIYKHIYERYLGLFHELQNMYLDKIVYCKPKDCTLVNFVGGMFDFELSVMFLKGYPLEAKTAPKN